MTELSRRGFVGGLLAALAAPLAWLRAGTPERSAEQIWEAFRPPEAPREEALPPIYCSMETYKELDRMARYFNEQFGIVFEGPGHLFYRRQKVLVRRDADSWPPPGARPQRRFQTKPAPGKWFEEFSYNGTPLVICPAGAAGIGRYCGPPDWNGGFNA